MTQVIIKKNEPVDKALRRLKKAMNKEGIMKEMKRLRHFEKPSEQRRRQKKESSKKR